MAELLEGSGGHCPQPCRVNSKKKSGAASEDVSVLIRDFSDVDVLAPVDALFTAGYQERFPKRHRLQIIDLHTPRQSDHLVQAVHLTHGFVENGGDNPAVSVARRTLVTAGKLEAAGRKASLFVEEELQAHALEVVFSATEAVILARPWFLGDFMAVSWSGLRHEDEREF